MDKQRKVRDPRSDNEGKMLHMFSILVGRSRTPAPELPHIGGTLSVLDGMPATDFLPTRSDVVSIKRNLADIISRILTKHISGLTPLSKAVPKHILHPYSHQMAQKSEVYALDVLMKNEAKHDQMIDIMRTLHQYLGEEYDASRVVVSGGDQLTCERQVGSQKLCRCADTPADRLQLVEPVSEDWHCLISLLRVSLSLNVYNNN